MRQVDCDTSFRIEELTEDGLLIYRDYNQIQFEIINGSDDVVDIAMITETSSCD